ncbi:penicillin-binding protein 2 [Gammaproteobacteria bacterium]|nr:penicillin-binding protein 2 [Gammaproteobacteria bacterium]
MNLIPAQIRRLNISLFIIFILFMTLIIRAGYLIIGQKDFLLGENQKRVERQVDVTPTRGMILDRNGLPLAVSKKTYTMTIDPRKANIDAQQVKTISHLLNIEEGQIIKAINSQKHYRIIAKKVSVKNKLALSSIPALNFEEQEVRVYPASESAATVVGFLNAKKEGVQGVERYHHPVLSGGKGRLSYVVDALGHVVGEKTMVRPLIFGEDVHLTIDAHLQMQVYGALKQSLAKFGGKSGMVLVSEVKTGDILAMVNFPSFNPNEAITGFNPMRGNPIIEERFEPGSTIKPIWLAWLMNRGHIDLDTTISTSPGFLKVDQQVVKDAQDNGQLSLTEIIKKSSNVGMVKIVMDMPYQWVEEMMIDMRLSHHRAVGLPGEISGDINHKIAVSKFAKVVSSFGYGIEITPLELARAYAIIASGGVDHPLHIHKDKRIKSERVIDRSAAKAVQQMLYEVVEGGTGYRAKVKGVKVAGKTGTTHKLVEGSYKDTAHRASFIGFAPLENPQYLVMVILDEPSGKWHYGGTSAAPLFSKVMQATLNDLARNSKLLKNQGKEGNVR